MSKLSVQSLANKINDKIKTNANKQITAAQLNEILIDITDSFQQVDASFPASQLSGLNAIIEANTKVSQNTILRQNFNDNVNSVPSVMANTNARHTHNQDLNTTNSPTFSGVKVNGQQVVGARKNNIEDLNELPAQLDGSSEELLAIFNEFYERISAILERLRAHGLISEI